MQLLPFIVYLSPKLTIFHILWGKERLLGRNSSKVSFLLKGGDKRSLTYINSELICDFFARFKSLLAIQGGVGNKLLSNWSCK